MEHKIDGKNTGYLSESFYILLIIQFTDPVEAGAGLTYITRPAITRLPAKGEPSEVNRAEPRPGSKLFLFEPGLVSCEFQGGEQTLFNAHQENCGLWPVQH